MAKHNRDDDVQSSSSSGMKRQRVALACNPCRTRKSRCNGARPKCSLCERMSFDCTYDAPGSAANVIIPKDAFTDIESRLHLLEQLVKRHNEQLSVRSLSSVASEKGISDGDVDSPPAGGLFGHQDADHELDDHTDGMAISFVDEKDQGFFGPSANISFMRIILRSMLAASTTGNGGGGGGSGGGSSNSINVKPLPSRSTPAASARTASSTTGVLLPPEDVTEHLLQEYFSNTGMLFPYIHEASFLETYRQARLSGFAGVRRTWLALLNIILAMATRANAAQTNTHSRTTDDADTFYRRAKKLCKTQMLHGLTLETVQYLLLSTQYLQGTQHAVQTWTTHGLAVKTALSIGLHSKVASAKFPVVEREMRKRTWYGCIVLDRSLSMTFGRPSAIPEDYVRLDLPMPIAGDREGGLSASFFSATVTLYRILWKIIASVYGHNIEHEDISTPDLMTRILQLEQDLDDWRSSLPPALRITSSIETSSPSAWSPSTARTPAQQVEKLRNIITLRYLNTKLLVLRPVLTNMLHTRFLSGAEAGNGYEVQHQQSEYFTSACFRAAVESIALIHAVVTRPDLGRHMLGAWWFTLCYAFNASLTVFGVLLMQPPPTQEDSEGKIDFSSPASYHSSNIQQGTRQGREALTKAIQALGALASDNALVDRCVEHLRQLVQVLDKRESSKPPMPPATSMTFPMDTSFVMGGMPTPTANGATGDFSEALNQGLVMSDTSMLGVGFPDYHTLLFDDEVGPGLFFSDSNNLDGGVAGAGQAQASWLDFGYQL